MGEDPRVRCGCANRRERKVRRWRFVATVAALGFIVAPVAGWKPGDGHQQHERIPPTLTDGDNYEARRMSTNRSLSLCAGLRGNGQRIWLHFTSLAKIVEDFGLIDGAAGASSATITLFLLDSIQSNPLIRDAPDDMERRARVSFLLKSLQGVQALAADADPIAIFSPVIAQIQAENLTQFSQSDDPTIRAVAMAKLLAILQDSPFASLVNQETVALLLNSPNPDFHLNDIVASATSNFVATDPLVFVRPFPLSFMGVMEKVDFAASFLAGLDPVDMNSMEVLLDQCATAGFGKEWKDIEGQPVEGHNATCGDFIANLFVDFISQRDVGVHPNRLNVRVGDNLKAMITTSVLMGDAARVYENAAKEYANASIPVTWDVNFDDVRFGYWGDGELLKWVEETLPQRFTDAKSKKFLSLPEAKWLDVLIRSPAEPSLSRAVEIDGTNFYSTGGWSDPVPAQVLSAMGCDKIILITRNFAISDFGRNVTKFLGATDEVFDDLFGLDEPESGWNTALREADGIWCPKVKTIPRNDSSGFSSAGWNAPLLTDDQDLQAGSKNYVDDVDIPECTPQMLLSGSSTDQPIPSSTEAPADAPTEAPADAPTEAPADTTSPDSGGFTLLANWLWLLSPVSYVFHGWF